MTASHCRRRRIIIHLVHRIAVKVHEPPALEVFDVNAICTLEGIHARGRKCLMEKYSGILVEQRCDRDRTCTSSKA